MAKLHEPGRAHDQLQPLIGRWTIEGRNANAAPVAGGARVRGERSYDWLPGRFFILGWWHHQFDSGDSHEGICTLGVDQATHAHVTHNYDNLGYARDYRIGIDGRRWTLTGPSERATLEFAADGGTFHEVWETQAEGVWVPLCEMHGARIAEGR